jgi:hypothetical protein
LSAIEFKKRKMDFHCVFCYKVVKYCIPSSQLSDMKNINTRSRDNEELIRFIANSSKDPGKDASWHITRLIVQILLPLIIWLIIRYSISMKSWGDSLSVIFSSRYIYSSIFSNLVYQGNTGSSHTKRMYRHTK